MATRLAGAIRSRQLVWLPLRVNGSCATTKVDTIAAQYSRELLPSLRVSAPLELPLEELRNIARALDEIGYFEFAATFRAVTPGASNITRARPATTYRLEVQRRGAAYTVTWDDRCRHDRAG